MEFGERDEHTKAGRPLLLGLAFGAIALIGWIRYLTGPEFAFSILFLVPIMAVAWTEGRNWGLAASGASALAWLMADLHMIGRFSSPWVPMVNEGLRLTVFVTVTLIISRYRCILERQKELATLDPLTGIANRRGFHTLARVELDRSRRYGNPFSVMVIDIDDFKKINDNLGHHAGDRLLVAVVETLRRNLRAIDIVSRFGGDEFVVLLVKTGEAAALAAAGKIRGQLLDLAERNGWAVTFSVGVAVYAAPPATVDETVRAADDLMYQVKNHGKNAVRHEVINP